MQNNFTQMPTGAEDICNRMDDLGIQYILYEHEPVFTVAESHKVDAMIPAHHTRNMFLRTKKKQNYLVTLSDDTPIDLKKLDQLLGCGRFSFGSPDRLFEALGVFPGSVTPLSLVNAEAGSIEVILEAKMMAADTIAVHPLRNDKTVTLAPDDLLKLLQSFGHEPRVMDLDSAQPEAA